MTTTPKPTPRRIGRNRAKDGWTETERLFVGHYLTGGMTGVDAAIAAGLRGTRKSSREWACKILAKPYVIAKIEEERAARAERLQFTADDVLRGLLTLKVEAEVMPKTPQTLKLRREILKDAGDHVAVGAFRRNVGLSSPTGGPIETIDLARLAQCTDEELETLERARAIIERINGAAPAEHGGDPAGTRAPSPGD